MSRRTQDAIWYIIAVLVLAAATALLLFALAWVIHALTGWQLPYWPVFVLVFFAEMVFGNATWSRG